MVGKPTFLRSYQSIGETIMPPLLKRPGPLLWDNVRKQGNGTGRGSSNLADFILFSLFWGSRPWNSSTVCSNAPIAEPSLYSPQASSYFSTIKTSKTTRNAASNARRSVPMGGLAFALRREQTALLVARKRLCRSVRLKDVRYCAALVFRKTNPRQRHRRHQLLGPRPRQVEESVAS